MWTVNAFLVIPQDYASLTVGLSWEVTSIKIVSVQNEFWNIKIYGSNGYKEHRSLTISICVIQMLLVSVFRVSGVACFCVPRFRCYLFLCSAI